MQVRERSIRAVLLVNVMPEKLITPTFRQSQERREPFQIPYCVEGDDPGGSYQLRHHAKWHLKAGTLHHSTFDREAPSNGRVSEHAVPTLVLALFVDRW